MPPRGFALAKQPLLALFARDCRSRPNEMSTRREDVNSSVKKRAQPPTMSESPVLAAKRKQTGERATTTTPLLSVASTFRGVLLPGCIVETTKTLPYLFLFIVYHRITRQLPPATPFRQKIVTSEDSRGARRGVFVFCFAHRTVLRRLQSVHCHIYTFIDLSFVVHIFDFRVTTVMVDPFAILCNQTTISSRFHKDNI